MRITLCALLLALAAFPLAARADDYGPKSDIAAIRHDLPILGAAEMDTGIPSEDAITVDAVVVDRDQALVQWTSRPVQRIYWLHKRYGRWWVNGEIFFNDRGVTKCCFWGNESSGASDWPARAFLPWLGASPEIIDLAMHHLPLAAATANTPPGSAGRDHFHGDPRPRDSLGFSDENAQEPYSHNYRVTVCFAESGAPSRAIISDFSARAPTEAESWASQPSGNSYFFFSGTVESPQTVHVQAGTTIDIWFPFALNPFLRYTLTVDAPRTLSLGPIRGTLQYNTLHFELPAFTAVPGAEVKGTVEGD